LKCETLAGDVLDHLACAESSPELKVVVRKTDARNEKNAKMDGVLKYGPIGRHLGQGWDYRKRRGKS